MSNELKKKLAELEVLLAEGILTQDERNHRRQQLLDAAFSLPTTGSPAGRPAQRGAVDTLLDFSTGMSLDAGDRKYRLEEKVGEGGMGVVWRAMDEAESEVIGKPAYKAIKTLHVSAEDDPVGYKRIKEEAILASRLSHPNIVRVFDWREDRDNKSPFIVMEWLPGKNLGKVLAEAGKPGLPLARVLELLSPVAEALDYAWKEHRLVHRDIKPGNVILTAEGKVKLLDFGIAVRVGSTKSKMVGYEGKEHAGTKRYRAPESKVKHAPQPQQDIYSLAVMAYELLEGEAPYDDNRSPHTPAPMKPEALNEAQWQALKRGMAWDADERPGNVKDFLAELARQASKPDPVKPASPRIEVVSYEALKVFRDPFLDGCGEGPEMVWLPQGEFIMGSDTYAHEQPVHKVQVGHPLAVGKYPVTFEEWDRFWAEVDGAKTPHDEGWGRGRRPVINVNFHDVECYCEWLTEKTGQAYRLLSEAEWEYACRSGMSTRYYWVASEADIGKYAVHKENSSGKTVEVGSKRANAWGLHDMSGNVWEWVEDCWNESYNGAPTDGSAWKSGDCSQRVLRGGSWYSVSRLVRSASRSRDRTGNCGNHYGFRVARTLP